MADRENYVRIRLVQLLVLDPLARTWILMLLVVAMALWVWPKLVYVVFINWNICAVFQAVLPLWNSVVVFVAQVHK